MLNNTILRCNGWEQCKDEFNNPIDNFWFKGSVMVELLGTGGYNVYLDSGDIVDEDGELAGTVSAPMFYPDLDIYDLEDFV